jgi:hypothetical protein
VFSTALLTDLADTALSLARRLELGPLPFVLGLEAVEIGVLEPSTSSPSDSDSDSISESKRGNSATRIGQSPLSLPPTISSLSDDSGHLLPKV